MTPKKPKKKLRKGSCSCLACDPKAGEIGRECSAKKSVAKPRKCEQVWWTIANNSSPMPEFCRIKKSEAIMAWSDGVYTLKANPHYKPVKIIVRLA